MSGEQSYPESQNPFGGFPLEWHMNAKGEFPTDYLYYQRQYYKDNVPFLYPANNKNYIDLLEKDETSVYCD